MGEIDKSETRAIAEKLKLNVATKPDSQDICFVPNGDYASVIKNLDLSLLNLEKFSILKERNRKARRNYKLYNRSKKRNKNFNSKPLYVVNIDADNNTIIVGSKECLEVKKIVLRDLNILGSKKELNEIINIKVRSTGRLLKAKINISKNSADVEILEKETGVSPGQACVFYSKDEVGDKMLGGGWIQRTFNKNLST